MTTEPRTAILRRRGGVLVAIDLNPPAGEAGAWERWGYTVEWLSEGEALAVWRAEMRARDRKTESIGQLGDTKAP